MTEQEELEIDRGFLVSSVEMTKRLIEKLTVDLEGFEYQLKLVDNKITKLGCDLEKK